MRRVAGATTLALATVAAGLSGCKSGRVVNADAGSPNAAPGSDQVLARVGERTITMADFEAALGHMDEFDRIRYQAPERRKELLGEMIDVMLLADEARARGYDKDAVTQQEVREILRDAMLKSAKEGALSPNDVSEADARAYYEAHAADFRDPERRRASAIVLSTEGTAAALVESAKGANPAQWGELVRTKSVEADAKPISPIDLAGDLGFVSPPGDSRGANPRVPEEVRAALFEIPQVGQTYPGVVKAKGKFYLVRFSSRSQAHERSFQDAERSIRVKLAQDDARAREHALLDGLRKQFPVRIDEAALAQVKVDSAGALPGDAGGHAQ